MGFSIVHRVICSKWHKTCFWARETSVEGSIKVGAYSEPWTPSSSQIVTLGTFQWLRFPLNICYQFYAIGKGDTCKGAGRHYSEFGTIFLHSYSYLQGAFVGKGTQWCDLFGKRENLMKMLGMQLLFYRFGFLVFRENVSTSHAFVLGSKVNTVGDSPPSSLPPSPLKLN